MGHEILPTGTCFDDALELMQDILKENQINGTVDPVLWNHLYLVHGITTCSGRESAHAWLEDDIKDRVCFVGILDGVRENFAAPRDQYYRELGITERTRYLYRDVQKINRRTGSFGPWDERYKGLCKNTSICDDYRIDKIGPL